MNHSQRFVELTDYLSENVTPTTKEYISEFFKDPYRKIEEVLGPYLNENNEFQIGVNFYDVNKGLLEPIFKKILISIFGKEDDLNKYRELVYYTSLHKRDYVTGGLVKVTVGMSMDIL